MHLLIIVIASILGIIIGLYFKISIAFFVILTTFIFFIICKIDKDKFKIAIKRILLFFTFLLIFYFIIQYHESNFEVRYKDIENKVDVIGTVVSEAKENEYRLQYEIKIESINGNNKYKGTKLLLNIKKDKEQKIEYADKIHLKGEFEFPETQRNTGGFDYKFYLKTQKIYGIIKADNKNVKVIRKGNVFIIDKLANKVANIIKEQSKKLFDNNKANILIGILIGDKNELQEDIKNNFKDSNLTHMLAVSGTHVSYILLGISFILNKIKILNKRYSKVFISFILLFYIFITGKTPSVERACIMSIYVLIGSFLYKKTATLFSICFSIFIMLIINPYCIFDIGFQLSFGGTIGILYVYPIVKKKYTKIDLKIKGTKFKIIYIFLTKIIDIILITLSVNITILPIVVYHFNTLSFTFWISNLLATPILGIIILLGFIIVILSIFVFPIAKFLSGILSIFLTLFLNIAEVCSKLPMSKLLVPTPNIVTIILYYLILFYIIFIENNIIRKKIINFRKIICIVLIVAICIPIRTIIPKGELKIFFIDVGQGDSMLLVTPNSKTILIDGGGSRDTNSFDIGKQTLIPYLLDRKITKIDYCIISHFDSDHVRSEY